MLLKFDLPWDSDNHKPVMLGMNRTLSRLDAGRIPFFRSTEEM